MAPTQRIWILGGGRFGRLAVERLLDRFGPADLLVVDTDPSAAAAAAARGLEAVREDGPRFLERCLAPAPPPEWIVPVLPLHLAYEWVRRRLAPLRRVRPVPVPDAVRALLPNVASGADGGVFASNADFQCPDDCPEPRRVCTVTGRPRLPVLHDRIARIQAAGWTAIVVVSRQLAPGVGGYAPAALFSALERMTPPGRYLLGTACKCHGVLHGLAIEGRAGEPTPRAGSEPLDLPEVNHGRN